MHPDGRLDISVPEAVKHPNSISFNCRGLETCEETISKCNDPAKFARLKSSSLFIISFCSVRLTVE